MIVDVHTHAWLPTEHLTESFRAESNRASSGKIKLDIKLDEYLAGATAVDKWIVFGGKAKLAGIWVPDDYVAAYVQKAEGRAIGFLSLDPSVDGWEDELRYGHQELGLKGVKLMPMYAGFYPHDTKLDPLWTYCEKHGLPVLLHTGTTFITKAPIDCTLPRHLDDVALRFPELRLVLAHLGHPYEGECIAVIRKHPHLYADVSALHYRPFQLYHSLMLAQEYGVWKKLLFGSDYPFTTVDASIEGLRRIGETFGGHGLPKLSMDEIEAMIHRDSLALLGL